MRVLSNLKITPATFAGVVRDWWFWLALSAIVYLPLPSYMPELEGKISPVTSKIDIQSIVPADNGGSIVNVSFSQIRDCKFKSVVWSKVGKDGTLEAAMVDFTPPMPSTSGDQMNASWKVDIAPHAIRDFSVSKITHVCHSAWNTVTQLWP